MFTLWRYFLFNLKIDPYTRYLKDVMPKDMEKEYEEHTKKTWEYVDKLCTLRFPSN